MSKKVTVILVFSFLSAVVIASYLVISALTTPRYVVKKKSDGEVVIEISKEEWGGAFGPNGFVGFKTTTYSIMAKGEWPNYEVVFAFDHSDTQYGGTVTFVSESKVKIDIVAKDHNSINGFDQFNGMHFLTNLKN